MSHILIGHRGEPSTYPESSILGYTKILQAGALFIETDIQLSADGIPLLCHDNNLKKITTTNANITQTHSSVALQLSAGYAKQFSNTFEHLKLSTLAQLATLLLQYPKTTTFIEIKEESLNVFGIKKTTSAILSVLGKVLNQCVFISFSFACIEHIKNNFNCPIGWVLKEYNNTNKMLASKLQPNYLFINYKKLPPTPEVIWHGNWQWAVYTINNYNKIAPLLNRGIDLIETNTFTKLSNHD